MKTKILVGLLLATTLVLALGIVGAVTIATPASSSVLSGTVAVNVSNSTNLIEMLNCSVYASSTLTANSTAVVIATGNNATAGAEWINMSADTTALEDANNYVIYVACSNATDTVTSSSLTGVTIDNTIPTAPTSLSPSTEQTSGTVVFSATVNGARTTACTLTFTGITPGSISSQAMTNTGNVCNTTISAIPDQTYTYTVTATDGTNSTASSSQQFTVATAPSGNYVPPEQTTTTAGEVSGGVSTTTILIIAGVILVAWLILKKR